MIQKIDFHIKELEDMKNYPSELYFIGDTKLLQKRKISIVGTRRPNPYTRQQTTLLSNLLAKEGFVIVSGGAMGTDAIAHDSAGAHNTIGVAGTGLDIRYPATNKKLIQQIEQEGLMLSQFPVSTRSYPSNFPLRNELVVALGEALIVSQCDMKSGTMHSINFARKMGKDIYVLPHRIGESEGTSFCLKNGYAKAIYNIEEFVSQLSGNTIKKETDPFLEYCKTNPTYDEAMQNYPSETFEYELNGKININNGIIQVN